jgi:hypothetical protein
MNSGLSHFKPTQQLVFAALLPSMNVASVSLGAFISVKHTNLCPLTVDLVLEALT